MNLLVNRLEWQPLLLVRCEFKMTTDLSLWIEFIITYMLLCAEQLRGRIRAVKGG